MQPSMFHPVGEQLPYYGAAPYPAKPAMGRPKPFNTVAMLLGLFLPWILFTFLYTVNTFTMRYDAPALANAVSLMCYCFAILFGYLAFAAFKKWKQNGHGSPGWYFFVFVTGLAACGVGQLGAGSNFNKNMRPYYDITSLNKYRSVDPAKYKGQQLMDMGQVTFTPGTRLELTRSMGFRNFDVYCVAPIVSANATMDTYDFWAVGLNCCSGHANDFACGEFNNPMSHSGLRLMRDDLRSYFRLAVQQASAAYNIKAPHPIFLYWMQDPVSEINAYQDQGYKEYLAGISFFFVLQLSLVAAAAIAFSKAGL